MPAVPRRRFLQNLAAGTAAVTLPGFMGSLTGCSRRPGRRPNFVFFLIDDMGWTDAGCYGSTLYETLHIDRLAADGMRFTDAYAACPVCSPTRASIMTGRYPARLNITDWIGGRQRGLMLPAEYEHALPLEEVTIAEALHEAGYSTGFFGKWHLGDEERFHPEHQGFDTNVAGHGAGHPASYWYPYERGGDGNTYWDVPDLENGREGEYLTDRLTDEALAWLDTNAGDPFLLYLAHYAVHTPIQGKPDLTARYEDKLAGMAPPEGPLSRRQKEWGGVTRLVQDNPEYAAMVSSVDESVGRVMAKLDQLGVSQDTIVIFMSDNGGLTTFANSPGAPTAVLPLRAGKGWLYEGGIREPMIVRWPGVVEPGSVCPEVVTSTDFYPTMLAMAGLESRPAQHLDGLDLTPLLRGSGSPGREAVYWHFPHYHGSGMRPAGAVRAGEWKLIEWYEDRRIELYNLRDDIGEEHDLAAAEPQKAAELKAMLEAWRRATDARMPRHDPGRAPVP